MAKKTTHSLRPKSNPHARDTELARAYEDGWRDGHRQTEELEETLDHVLEVIAGAEIRNELCSGSKSGRRRSVIDVDELIRRDYARERKEPGPEVGC